MAEPQAPDVKRMMQGIELYLLRTLRSDILDHVNEWYVR